MHPRFLRPEHHGQLTAEVVAQPDHHAGADFRHAADRAQKPDDLRAAIRWADVVLGRSESAICLLGRR
jgi:hypothetical protein